MKTFNNPDDLAQAERHTGLRNPPTTQTKQGSGELAKRSHNLTKTGSRREESEHMTNNRNLNGPVTSRKHKVL